MDLPFDYAPCLVDLEVGLGFVGLKGGDLFRISCPFLGKVWKKHEKTSPGLKGLKKNDGSHHSPSTRFFKMTSFGPIFVTFSGLKCPPFGESKGLSEEAGIFCV